MQASGFVIRTLARQRRLDWLGGYKHFAETDDGQADEGRSLEAPLQRFHWSDCTLDPERVYRQASFPMRGKPGGLVRENLENTSGKSDGTRQWLVNRLPARVGMPLFLSRILSRHERTGRWDPDIVTQTPQEI